MSTLQTPLVSTGKAAADERLLRVVRILAPIVVLTVSIGLWSLIVRIDNIQP